ncbi:MAG TPA: hypothetical protein VFW78_04705 [Bacteroidia bacterium]|nr:hypothetical protein [Bacteroidia bacterium]
MSNYSQLAHEIADALNDQNSLQLFQSFTERYPEEFLREILAKVQEVPDEKIKKTRGALFTFLIKQHEQGTEDNIGNQFGD